METAETFVTPTAAAHIVASMAHSRAFYDGAEGRFLDAWKAGVQMAGMELFMAGQGYNKPEGIEAATSIWQLVPDIEAIHLFSGASSTGEVIFLGVLVSFYNHDIGNELVEKAGYPGLSALSRLDFEAREIVNELIANYTGW